MRRFFIGQGNMLFLRQPIRDLWTADIIPSRCSGGAGRGGEGAALTTTSPGLPTSDISRHTEATLYNIYWRFD